MISNNQMVSPNMLGEKFIQNPSDPNSNTALNNNYYSYGNPFASYGSNTYASGQTNHFGDPNMQLPIFPTQENLNAFNNKITGLGFEKLLRVQGLFMKRKPAKCCKRYVHQHAFYPLDVEGKYKKGTKLFRSSEKVRCWTCTFGPHDSNMTFCDKNNSEFDGQSFIALEKEDECGCKCIDQIPVKVFLTEGGQKTFIGSTTRLPGCKDIIYHVKDNNEGLHFLIKMSPQEGCELVKYEILAPDETKIGEIKSIRLDCMLVKFAYSIVFPERADGLERTLLTGAVMALERIEFETRNNF